MERASKSEASETVAASFPKVGLALSKTTKLISSVTSISVNIITINITIIAGRPAGKSVDFYSPLPLVYVRTRAYVCVFPQARK